jgi:hypothetical protein
MLICAAAVVAPLGLLFSATPSQAKPPPTPTPASSLYQVQVGYADTFHGSNANFPSPFAGDPSVVYNGCNPATCSFDGGAIRVVNTSGGALMVDSVTVTIGGGATPCPLDLWGHNQSVPAGDSLVLAQTATGPGISCDNPAGTFDGSDMGVDGAAFTGDCVPSGLAFQVTVTVQDPVTNQPVSTTYSDSGEILNTGGIDLAECPGPDTNESSNWWIPIGQTTGSTFVISDLVTSTTGSGVTFWGSQWAKANLLGGSISGFKGFNPSVTTTTTCGSTWQSTAGNSSDPPNPPLPAVIPIIVTGPITKVGNLYQGTIEHILLVSTDPGYGGNPGHHGTGTVVSEVC